MTGELHQRVREIFDGAVVLPKAERQAYLESLCRRDTDLYQGVLQLLTAHDQSPYFLGDDTRRSPRLGRYILTGELGRGAMGIVYQAVDPLIGRNVAIKTVSLKAISEATEAEFMREGLLREAHSAGVLSHPGIVIIFDVGQEADTTFIAMERVNGVTLQRIMESGQTLERIKILDILRQTADALDYAHRNGVVHRDVKPANVMLHQAATVKITDFGIAKIAHAQHHTMTGMVMGTPTYMSPEQIEAQPADGRSDQFALAIMAYQLFTGVRPFSGDSFTSLAHNIVYGIRPSALILNPTLPVAVDTVLCKALSRSPEDRYPTCLAFVDALAGVFEANPITPARLVASDAPAATSPARAPTPAISSKFVVAATALAILLVAAAAYKLLGPKASVRIAPALPSVSSPGTGAASLPWSRGREFWRSTRNQPP
jgi:serine/threonine protein kinase